MSRIIGTVVAALLSAGAAQAEVRNFFAPHVAGVRLDACLSSHSECGKPAADAFCKVNGFANALMFQREAIELPTRSMQVEEMCKGGSCTAFRQIKCFTPRQQSAQG